MEILELCSTDSKVRTLRVLLLWWYLLKFTSMLLLHAEELKRSVFCLEASDPEAWIKVFSISHLVLNMWFGQEKEGASKYISL